MLREARSDFRPFLVLKDGFLMKQGTYTVELLQTMKFEFPLSGSRAQRPRNASRVPDYRHGRLLTIRKFLQEIYFEIWFFFGRFVFITKTFFYEAFCFLLNRCVLLFLWDNLPHTVKLSNMMMSSWNIRHWRQECGSTEFVLGTLHKPFSFLYLSALPIKTNMYLFVNLITSYCRIHPEYSLFKLGNSGA